MNSVCIEYKVQVPEITTVGVLVMIQEYLIKVLYLLTKKFIFVTDNKLL